MRSNITKTSFLGFYMTHICTKFHLFLVNNFSIFAHTHKGPHR